MNKIKYLASVLLLLLLSVSAEGTVNRACDYTVGSTTTATGFANCTEEFVEVYKRGVVTTTGASGTNAIVSTSTPAVTTLTDGLEVYVTPANTISGPATYQLDSTAAASIITPDGTALASGDLVAGIRYKLSYRVSAANWILISPPSVTAVVPNNSITDAKLRDSAGTSVIGRASNTTGDPADITAAADDRILGRAGGALSFRQIANADVTTNTLAYSKLQQATTLTLLGNPTGSTANVQEITLGPNLLFTGSVLDVTGAATITTTTGISAAGSTQGTATVLTATTSIQGWVVSTVAASAGVRLPTAAINVRYSIINKGANALKVYGASTNTIDGVATATGISIPVGGAVWFIPESATAWETIRQPILSGDVATSSTDPLTTVIQADAVGLGTDTTGNYQSGNTAGVGIAITQTPAEGFSSTVALAYTDTLAGNPSLAVGQCVLSSEGSTGGGFICEGSVADGFEAAYRFADVTGADATRTLLSDATAAGGDLTGTYPNPTVAANAVALATDTTGNYMSDVSAGNGVAITHTPAEGSTATIALKFSDTLAGNPALNANECEFTTTGAGGGFLCEGSVADAFEGNFVFPDITGADATQTVVTTTTGATLYQPLDSDLTSWAAITRASGFDTFAATATSANLRTLLSDELGTGVLVFLGAPADDQVAVGDSATATTWRTLPTTSATQKLSYDATTNTFSAATDDDVPEAGDFGALTATLPITQSGGTISTSMTTARLLGRTTAATGVAEEISVGSFLSFSALSLNLGDVELTSIGNLTSAADQLPYYTGSGTAALTTLTTTGRSLIDDTSTGAMLTTLSAAGTAISNNFAADQTISSTDAGATIQPNLILDRNSASPAVSDILAGIVFRGRDSGAAVQDYTGLQTTITDPTAASEDATLDVNTVVAGTFAKRFSIGNGLYYGSGTDQGANTINALNLFVAGANISTIYQPLDTELTCFSGLTSAADKIAYFTGAGTCAVTDFSSAVRTLITTPSSANLRAMLNDEVGTGTAMFGLISTMNNDLGCTASQVVRRNPGNTAFECATLSGTGDLLSSNNLSDVASAATSRTNLGFNSYVNLATTMTDEIGTGPLMFGLVSTMSDDLGCTGSQVVQRNAGDTAFACVTLSGTGTVTNVASGTGITGGPITATGTLSFDFSDAGASPALATDEARFTSNATVAGNVVFEGDTVDAFESRVVITDPTADRAFTIPNADSVAVQPTTCAGSVSAVSSLGVLTCSSFTATTGISAAGTTQGTATALTSTSAYQTFEVTTVTTGSATGVLLPASDPRYHVVIVNRGAGILSIYPTSTGTIDGGTASAAITIQPKSAITLAAKDSSNNWFSQVTVPQWRPAVRLTSGTTWTSNANSKYVRVTVVGGGGGGGGVSSATLGATGGGGGYGGIAIKTYSTLPSTGYTIAVGAAGAAGANTGGTGGTGGSTTFTDGTTLITGSGGVGGIGSTTLTSALGGVGGSGTNGDININGANGGFSFGTTTSNATAGGGGSGMYGAGGNATKTNGAGNAGLALGGGGGGAAIISTGAQLGGAGAAGGLIIEEFY